MYTASYSMSIHKGDGLNTQKLPVIEREQLQIVQRLLQDLRDSNHPAADTLTAAWAIELFLQGDRPLDEVAAASGVPSGTIQQLIQQRHLSFLLDTTRQTPTTATEPDTPVISVVLPIYNEADNIPELFRRLTVTLEAIDSCEIIFVNDGSFDNSEQIISELKAQHGALVRLISLSRNFGHQAAITAGIDFSRGRAVVLMDADLQDPPELLSSMIEQWKQGYHVVYAVREKRQEGVLKKSAYFFFYRLLRLLAEIDVPLDSGDFCLMDREVVEHLKRLPERTRFLRGLRSWVGFNQCAVHYERSARYKGKPKYTTRKLVKLAVDGLLSFSSAPLRLASYIGFMASLTGIAYLAYAVYAKLTNGAVPVGWTSTVALILIMGGAQLLLLGILGEYVARIYEESKERPHYVVRKIVD